MLEDRYGNPISTASAAARDAYVDAADRLLMAQSGAEAAFEASIAADPAFALAHVGLARTRQAIGDGKGAQAAFERIKDAPGPLTAREAGHFNAFALSFAGDGPGAYKAIRDHLLDYPRDALIAQTCMGVFGMIGFSGRPGREAEQLAFSTALAPHYGEDSWFLCQHAFAMGEAGQIDPAVTTSERAFELNPRNAHAAHVRAHVYYEAGESAAGLEFIRDWREGYDRGGALHCHVSWHVALWSLEQGDVEAMWRIVDADIGPGRTWGPALNVMTDTAAILYRAELAGVDVPAERWAEVSRFAQDAFPAPGIAFGDVHAALAHAMAGDGAALARIKSDARGPAADTVRQVAAGFQAIADGRWADASAELVRALADHERLGGSRAQRDLLEYAYLNTLLKQGAVDEARRHLVMRRPRQVAAPRLAGLAPLH